MPVIYFKASQYFGERHPMDKYVLGRSRFGAFLGGLRRRIVCVHFRRFQNLVRNAPRRDEIHNFLNTIFRGHAWAQLSRAGTALACGPFRLLLSWSGHVSLFDFSGRSRACALRAQLDLRDRVNLEDGWHAALQTGRPWRLPCAVGRVEE